jgi:RNA polymerase sigma-70 factor, ECF subfamily
MGRSPTVTGGGQPAAEMAAQQDFRTDLLEPPNISASIVDVPMEADEIEVRTDVRTLDSRWVERAKEGDAEAFGELYRRHHPSLFRLARAHLGEGAEDAVAETFMRAWKTLARYRDTGAPFFSWLYGIARHVIADEFRRRARVEPRPDFPDRRVDWAVDDKLTLAAAIRQLPDEQRHVVELKFLMGATNAEVAATLGKSVDAVNAKQWRALAALRKTLEEE